MLYAPFDTVGMDDHEVLLLKETCEALSNTYKTEFININDHKDFSSILNDFPGNISGIVLVENTMFTCILVFTKCVFRKSNLFIPNSVFNSFQVCAFSQLRKNFGTIFIREKTFTYKVMDIFLSTSVRLKNYNLFNSKFYVLCDDKEKARVTLNDEVIDLLMNINTENFLISISNQHMLVECPFALNPKTTVKLAEFVCSMSVI